MNPFTEHGRITNPHHFAGRWRELSLIFERLEAQRPVLIIGPKAIGKSSLLTHIAQSAATAMDRYELITLYIDLSVLPDAAALYEMIINEIHGSGSTPAALEVALLVAQEPILLCLDGVETAIAAGWGNEVLERLARMTRGSATGEAKGSTTSSSYLLLVATMCGTPPSCSDSFSLVHLGAFGVTEVRLVTEAYLHDSDILFSTDDLRDLVGLSAGHPAYLQRAAFHLFKAKTQTSYDWRAAYIKEAREQLEPGAPLPPGVFEGDKHIDVAVSTYGDLDDHAFAVKPLKRQATDLTLKDLGGILILLLSVVAGLVIFQAVGNWQVAGGIVIGGIIVTIIVERVRAKR